MNKANVQKTYILHFNSRTVYCPNKALKFENGRYSTVNHNSILTTPVRSCAPQSLNMHKVRFAN